MNVDEVQKDIKFDLSVYEHFQRKIKAIEICVSLAKSGKSVNFEPYLDGAYNFAYAEWLKEKGCHQAYIKSLRDTNKRARAALRMLQQRGEAVELPYLEEIFGLLTPFMDETTFSMNKRYGVIIKDERGDETGGVDLGNLPLEIQVLREKCDKALLPFPDGELASRLRGRVVEHVHEQEILEGMLARRPEDATDEWQLKIFKKRVANLLEFERTEKEIRGEQIKLWKKKGEQKGKGEFVSGASSVSSGAIVVQSAAAAGASAEPPFVQTFAEAFYSSDEPVALKDGKRKSEEKSGSQSFSYPTKRPEKDRKERLVLDPDVEKIKKAVEKFKSQQGTVRYENLNAIIERMDGRILSSGGSHRRIEVPHVATGKIVIGGTYKPHKGQKGYPLWLELAMDVIDRAMA